MTPPPDFRTDFRRLPQFQTSARAKPQKTSVCGSVRKSEIDLFQWTSAGPRDAVENIGEFAAEVAAEVRAEVSLYIYPLPMGERPMGLPLGDDEGEDHADQGRFAHEARARDQSPRAGYEPPFEGREALEAPKLEARPAQEGFPLLEQFRADIARRQAIIAGAADWQECGRRLHAAGEMTDFTARALDLIP